MKSLFVLAMLLAPAAFAQKPTSRTQILEFTQQSTFCQAVYVSPDTHGSPAHVVFYCDNGSITYNFLGNDMVTNGYRGILVAQELLSPQLSVRLCGGGGGQRFNCTFMQQSAVRNAPQLDLSAHAKDATLCYVKMEKSWFDPKRRALVFDCDNGLAKYPLTDADNILNEQAAFDWARSLLQEFKVIHCDYYFGGSCLFSR